MTTQFPKTIRAAKAVSTDEKTLAAAIFTEIPPRRQGPQPKDSRPVEDLLADLAIDLAVEGYSYSAETLRDYRDIAAWAAKGNSGSQAGIEWQPVSWSMHKEAFKGGMTWNAFAKHVANGLKTVDDLRRAMNKQPTRKSKPSEKLGAVKDAIKAGEISPQDVADALAEAGVTEDVVDASPEGAVTQGFHKQRRRRIQRDIDAGTEGMTDEEIEESDKALDALGQTAGDLADMGQKMADAIEGPVARRVRIAAREVSMASVLFNKQGLLDGEQDAVLDHLIDLRHAADLLQMAVEGKSLSAADQQFLTDLGIAV